jgi:hypothetical protein
MKYYSLTCNYIIEVPEEVQYEELQGDLSDVIIETASSHDGRVTGKLTLIRCNEEGHTQEQLK